MEALQGTAHYQTQLEQLIGEYRGQLELVMNKQTEMEKLVGSLQSDIHSIKSEMHEVMLNREVGEAAVVVHSWAVHILRGAHLK